MGAARRDDGERAPSFETLVLEVRDDVACLTLNRPEKLNVMNVAMREELFAALEEIRARDDVRALVVTGAGTAFSAGGDVNDFVPRSAEDMHELMRDRSHRWFKALWELPCPTVAAVNGVAAGGGINLAIACDFVVAAETARFGQTFIKVGLVPDLGGLFLLPRAVGLHRAKAMCLTGDLVSAAEAHALGFVYQVVPPGELPGAALGLARRLAAQPTHAYAATKALLHRSFESSMEEILQGEHYAQSFLFSTSEHRALLEGFLGRNGAQGGK